MSIHISSSSLFTAAIKLWTEVGFFQVSTGIKCAEIRSSGIDRLLGAAPNIFDGSKHEACYSIQQIRLYHRSSLPMRFILFKGCFDVWLFLRCKHKHIFPELRSCCLWRPANRAAPNIFDGSKHEACYSIQQIRLYHRSSLSMRFILFKGCFDVWLFLRCKHKHIFPELRSCCLWRPANRMLTMSFIILLNGFVFFAAEDSCPVNLFSSIWYLYSSTDTFPRKDFIVLNRDYTMQPLFQELVVRDLHNNTWTFCHIYTAADKQTDEIYAHMSLRPVHFVSLTTIIYIQGKYSITVIIIPLLPIPERDVFPIPDFGLKPSKHPTAFVCKTLTAGDTGLHDAASTSRTCRPRFA
ncbi:hypothetical protein OROHE_016820 [Orobanche hederae]